MPTTTPQRLDRQTIDFCRQINRSAVPVYVDIAPTERAVPQECFHNVRAHVAAHGGGTIVYGWCVGHWPGLFIEAEHHAVWESPEGALLDVTPRRDRQTRCLFVRDDAATYDWSGMNDRDNVRLALTHDPVIQRFLDAGAAIFRFRRHYCTDGKTIKAPEAELMRVRTEHAHALVDLYRKYLGVNDLCPCLSGKKVKRCHGLERARQGMAGVTTFND